DVVAARAAARAVVRRVHRRARGQDGLVVDVTALVLRLREAPQAVEVGLQLVLPGLLAGEVGEGGVLATDRVRAVTERGEAGATLGRRDQRRAQLGVVEADRRDAARAERAPLGAPMVLASVLEQREAAG